MEFLDDLSRLSMPVALVSVLLALGESKRFVWFVMLEDCLEKISQASLIDTIFLLPVIIEILVIFAMLLFYILLGIKFKHEDLKFLYATLAICVVISPFLVRTMKDFSYGKPVTTMGLIIAAFGFSINIINDFYK